jgi:WD40 repeat protein
LVCAAFSVCSDWRTNPGLDANRNRTSGLARSISARRRRRLWAFRNTQSGHAFLYCREPLVEVEEQVVVIALRGDVKQAQYARHWIVWREWAGLVEVTDHPQNEFAQPAQSQVLRLPIIMSAQPVRHGHEDDLQLPLSGKHLRILQGPGGQVMDVDFSPDVRLLAARAGCRLRVWDLKTFEACYTTPEGPEEEFASVVFSPDGRWLVVGAHKPTRLLRVHDARTFKPIKELPDTFRGCFSPDGKLFAAYQDGQTTIELWNPATWTPVKRLTRHASIRVTCTFSPDGKLFAACSDGRLQVWKTATFLPAGAFELPGMSEATGFLADSKTILTLRQEEGRPVTWYERWDATTGKRVGEFEVGSPSSFWMDSVSPDRRQLMLVDHDGVPP